MVLGCDVAPSSPQIHSGLVHTTISVLELVSRCTGGDRKKLVTETNSENGFGILESKSILDGFNGSTAHLGITGSIGDKESVPFDIGGVGFKVIVEWHHCQFDLVCDDEESDNVVFHTAIVGDDLGFVAFSVCDDFFGGYFSDEVSLVGVEVESFWFILRRRSLGVLSYHVNVLFHEYCDYDWLWYWYTLICMYIYTHIYICI
jgi:hypothetical protein